MDFNATPMPEPESIETSNIFDDNKTPTLSENSYETFLKPEVISNEDISKTFVADLSKNSLYRKRMDRRRLETNSLYSVQLMDNPIEYTTEYYGHINNYLCSKYQILLDTFQLKNLKDRGLIVVQLNDHKKITITKTDK